MESTEKPRLWTRTFAAMCGAGFLTYVAFYSMLPAMPLYLDEKLGMSSGMAGVALSAYTITAVTMRMLCGWLLDNYGRRVIYLTALLFLSAIFLLYPFAANGAVMIALRMLHGAVWGIATTAAQTAVADTVPPARRGEGIGLFGLFFSIAMALSPVCGTLVMKHSGFGALFIMEAAAVLLALILAHFASFRPAATTRIAFDPRRLMERSTMPVGLAAFLFFLGYGSVMNWVAVYAKTIDGANPGLFFTCLAAGTGCMRLFSGKVYDRRGPVLICGVAFAVFASGLFLLGLCPHRAVFYPVGALLGAGAGIFLPVCMAIINSIVPPERRGAANSTFLTMFDCGIGCGILLTGFLLPLVGVGGAFGLFGIVTLLAAALFYLFSWPVSRRAGKNDALPGRPAAPDSPGSSRI